MGHHQEADGFEAEFAGESEVLDRDVGFGAVGGDADDGHAGVAAGAHVVHGADAGDHEGGDLGVLGGFDGGSS